MTKQAIFNTLHEKNKKHRNSSEINWGLYVTL